LKRRVWRIKHTLCCVLRPRIPCDIFLCVGLLP
jgi:hypothetical protein